MSALAPLISQIATLSLEDQRTLNTLLVQNIRAIQKRKSSIVATTFKVGDVVKFDGKTRGKVFMKITGFSRDLSKIKGLQLNKGWKTHAGTQWTVGASACTASTAEAAAEAEANKF